MADLPGKPREDHGVYRLLHGADHSLSGVVRVPGAGSPPPADRAFQRHRASDGRVDRTATEVHSLAETQKLGSTEFPRRTVPILASRHDKTPMFAIRSVDFSCFSIVAGEDSPNI
jgi:hypothetical protein